MSDFKAHEYSDMSDKSEHKRYGMISHRIYDDKYTLELFHRDSFGDLYTRLKGDMDTETEALNFVKLWLGNPIMIEKKEI